MNTFPTLPFPPMAEAIFSLPAGRMTCLFPVDDDAEFRFCGDPVAMRLDGKPSSYCDCHRKLAISGTLKAIGLAGGRS